MSLLKLENLKFNPLTPNSYSKLVVSRYTISPKNSCFEILLLSLILIFGFAIIQEVNHLLFRLTKHASEELAKPGRQQIQLKWIEQALKNPAYQDTDSRSNATRVWKRIPEYENRALRVVYNPETEPISVITVFFDRNFKQ